MEMTGDADGMDDRARFEHARYTVRAKILRIFGGAFHIYGPDGALALYTEQKRFRLKEDIRLYADESMRRELLRISTQSVFDLAGAYDVRDSVTGERVGTLKRSAVSSTFVRDHWSILDGEGNAIGELQEDSTLKALVRRYVDIVALFMPQRYHMTLGGQAVAHFRQRFNPLVLKLEVDFSPDPGARLDRRLGLAAAVLLSAIEGRQD